MKSKNDLISIQEKYKDYNLLIPTASEVQINPFYKFVVQEVSVDTSENSSDIFKVGSVKTGKKTRDDKDIYENVYSPAKPLLMKLAAAAGIQFDPNNTGGEYVSKNCYKARAFGAIRMADGTGRTHYDEKVINLDDEEDRFRLEFMDKSIGGITEKKAAEEAAKLFQGTWIETTNKWGDPCKAYRIDDQDRQKYIERSVLINMTLLRKTFAEKAMTGAILRVIRALIGMKGTYTMAELKKSFAIPRVVFNPDFGDPSVRKAMMDMGMTSITNMFGTSSGSNYLSDLEFDKVPVISSETGVENFNVSEFVDNPAFQSEKPELDVSNDFGLEPDFLQPDGGGEEPYCVECGKELNDKTYNYSLRVFKKPLCYECQKKEVLS